MNGDPFMQSEEFFKAKLNRNRQQIIYPDIRQETDASKLQRRTISAQQRAARPTQSTQQKLKPVWNSVTKRMKY